MVSTKKMSFPQAYFRFRWVSGLLSGGLKSSQDKHGIVINGVDVSQFSGSFLLRLPAILGTKMPSDDERATCTSFDTILWVF